MAAPAAAATGATTGLSFETVLGGITKAASSMMAGQAQAQAAAAQAAYQQQLAEQRAQQNYEQQVALRQEQAQEDESISRKRLEAELKTRAAKSTALTAAASAGVSGPSVDALLSEYNIQSSMYLEGLERQRQLNEAITQQNITNIGQNVYIPAPVEQPSPMIGVLGGVNSFLGFLSESNSTSSNLRRSNLNQL